MNRAAIMTLTTDFGVEGPYVAALKGVILGMAPAVTFIDVTHAIAPQNVLEGAFVLAGIVDVFPAGTVHLAVIDPGVGTDRRLLAAKVSDQWFVLPDNGLLTGVLLNRVLQQAHWIESLTLRRPIVSPTFHGRDLLAPAAAHLLTGGDPSDLGPPANRIVKLANFEPRPDQSGFVGEVIFRDTFGNLITNISAEYLSDSPPDSWTAVIAGEKVRGLSRTYGENPPGSLVALIGSGGWVEFALVNGDAARHLSAGPGATVWFHRST